MHRAHDAHIDQQIVFGCASTDPGHALAAASTAHIAHLCKRMHKLQLMWFAPLGGNQSQPEDPAPTLHGVGNDWLGSMKGVVWKLDANWRLLLSPTCTPHTQFKYGA